ncbi:hypothetical protein HPB47_009341, partial [Ixodes persulcatus]
MACSSSSVSAPTAGGAHGPNRLAGEKSPYLLQHANNPVDWYPWGEEAIARAKSEDKPIFLSVGYSTCHWCHVMERESFENVDIARLMNEHFVNVKVDREERPDLDRVYMTYIQATSGGGGWPMSVWLTPDLKPIVGGTYFPPDDRYFGRPGFKTLLAAIAEQWRTNRTKLLDQGSRIVEILRQASDLRSSDEQGSGRCRVHLGERGGPARQLSRSYDEAAGGFGKAPKFPQCVNLNFLLRHAVASQEPGEAAKGARNVRQHAEQDGTRRDPRPRGQGEVSVASPTVPQKALPRFLPDVNAVINRGVADEADAHSASLSIMTARGSFVSSKLGRRDWHWLRPTARKSDGVTFRLWGRHLLLCWGPVWMRGQNGRPNRPVQDRFQAPVGAFAASDEESKSSGSAWRLRKLWKKARENVIVVPAAEAFVECQAVAEQASVRSTAADAARIASGHSRTPPSSGGNGGITYLGHSGRPSRPSVHTWARGEGSTATQRTAAGTCRTSRRCCTTRRSWPRAYLEAFQATRDPHLARVARDVLDYVERDLSHQSGGFYSAEDADSLPEAGSGEKKEGAFCVWEEAEVRQLLPEPLPGCPDRTVADLFCRHLGIEATGNVDPMQDPHDELKGKNVLVVRESEESLAERFGLELPVLRSLLEDARRVLLEARQRRPRPHLDDKFLAAWNGLMVSGFATAAKVLGDRRYAERALRAVAFLNQHLYDEDRKSLLRSAYRGEDGRITQAARPIPGVLEDYAFTVQGLLDTYEACFDTPCLLRAEELQDAQDARFWDPDQGGYFLSSGEDAHLLLRLKDVTDASRNDRSRVQGVARVWAGRGGPDASRVWAGPGPDPAEAYVARPGPGFL